MGNRRIRVSVDPEHPWMFFNINVGNDQRTYQVHRVGGGINFKANRKALSELTPQAYMLYMVMLLDMNDREWVFDEEGICSKTTLKNEQIEPSFEELVARGYLIPGMIDVGGSSHKHYAFHLWEDPLCQTEAV